MNPEDAIEAYRAVTSTTVGVRRAGRCIGDVSSHRRTRRGTAVAICTTMKRSCLSASRELTLAIGETKRL
jgi:hypothetical protein